MILNCNSIELLLKHISDKYIQILTWFFVSFGSTWLDFRDGEVSMATRSFRCVRCLHITQVCRFSSHSAMHRRWYTCAQGSSTVSGPRSAGTPAASPAIRAEGGSNRDSLQMMQQSSSISSFHLRWALSRVAFMLPLLSFNELLTLLLL